MEIRDIFENYVKIESKVMSIDSLFNNEDRVTNTNYTPSYQRNYVWDDEKATYFIESILLGTEIPPLIYFRNGDKVEVIDGRQRYQTILRFTNNQFKLKKNGLQKLENIGIANKYFKNIDLRLKDFFWDTKLRIIEFSFHSKNLVNAEMEEVVKKEIFKRYNSGITPLKPTDIDKAAYFEDDLNSYFKRKLTEDLVLYDEISSLLHFEKTNIEKILKKIRQLLVLHRIPIKYYSVRKESVITRYFEFLSSSITTEEEIEILYSNFIKKVNILKRFRIIFSNQNNLYNRLFFETIFWALSIVEEEGHKLNLVTENFLNELSSYLGSNKEVFKMERSSFAKELNFRYYTIANFFHNSFGTDFTAYLQNNPDFKAQNKIALAIREEITSFDELRINKPEPASTAIDDICRQMERQRFLIRPPYQRNEVINKKKSSAIIESILMGIKLPPIFVFKRKDDVSEVLDGQQRLLSILGFMKKPYLDENNEKKYSGKNGYALNLKNGILKNLNGYTFESLTKEESDKIKNFDLWIIEISEKNNEHFESIDLFIRLNNKPYPIKEDTFEMWNSYISRDVIDSIKSIHKNNKDWFYLRKNNSRMEDENIYTFLIYLQYQVNKNGYSEEIITRHLDIYKILDKINFRVKSKVEISKVLENLGDKEDLIKACFDFEFGFLKTLKFLLTDDSREESANENLDLIFNKENNRRTQQGFYALWYFLYDKSIEKIGESKHSLRSELKSLYILMDKVDTKQDFDRAVSLFRNKSHSRQVVLFPDPLSKISSIAPITLGKISNIHIGLNHNQLEEFSSSKNKDSFTALKDVTIYNFQVSGDILSKASLDDKDQTLRDFFESKQKIIIKRVVSNRLRLEVGLNNDKSVYNNSVLILSINRYGFDAKFILALLSSRLVAYWLTSTSSSLNSHYNLTVNIVKSLPIPILTVRQQSIFSTIVDFLLTLDIKQPSHAFFQRLLDAMVYELYFPNELKNANSQIISLLDHAPQIISLNEAKIEEINKYYKELSDPNHPVSNALLNLLTVEEVTEIEGVI